MKKIIITSFIILLFAQSALSINQTGKNLAVGYGYVAGVENINAVTVNPANLHLLNYDEVMVSFNRPFIFHSLFIGIPFIYERVIGLAFINNNNNFKQYRLGINLFNINILRLGLAAGIDREISSSEKDKWGFVLSPGACLEVVNKKKDNFSINLGVNYKNLFAANEFGIYKDLTKNNIDFGLRSEIFINSLFLNMGINYVEEIDYNGSLEYSIMKPLKLIIITGKNSYGCGSEYTINSHEVAFAYLYDKNEESFNYSLSYKVRVGTRTRKSVTSKKPKKPRKQILEKQKELLEKGLRLYKRKRYKEARETWRRLNRMDRSTEYAKRARQYIIKVNNILKSIEEE